MKSDAENVAKPSSPAESQDADNSKGGDENSEISMELKQPLLLEQPLQQPQQPQPQQPPPQQQQPQQQQQLQLQQNQLIGAPTCWKSTPGAGSANCHQPPTLSVSAILPLSAAPSCIKQGESEQRSKKKQKHHHHSRQKRSAREDSSDRTMLPAAAANAAAAAVSGEPGFAKRFFSNPRVRRSLAIDAATVLIFVPLSVSTSIALMNLFVNRVGVDNLEWHHYLLVAALASICLIPICRLAYSAHRYRKRIHRMKCCDINYLMRHPSKDRLPEYTIKRRRMEAECAANPEFLQYHEFAYMVARQQNINLSRRAGGGGVAADMSAYRSVMAPWATAGDRSGGISGISSGISCHRPDISMAAYNC